MARFKRKQQHYSRIHSLRSQKSLSRTTSDGSVLGSPGFSRVVYCNDPQCPEAQQLGYCDNYVKTTKYTLISFLPKSLFEQFRRVANLFFLLCAFLSFTPMSPYSPLSSVLPLVFVVAVTMVKELVEDWRRRKQDIEVNNRKTLAHCGNGVFEPKKWMDLRVGDIVKIEKDEFFPSDLILLSSSYDEGICYVETTNLDGETNLKLKQAVEVTIGLNEDSMFQNFRAVIRCEDPNAKLYSFVGSLGFGEERHPLSPQQILLRDSKLMNTDYIYGVCIFTGHDTKLLQNSVAAPSKRSKIERRTDKIVFVLFFMLFAMAVSGSVYFGIMTSEDLIDDGTSMTRWYLRPDKTTIYYDPKRAAIAAVLHFVRAVMLYSYLIPISLYVSIELVKILQSEFINRDIQMYYVEGNKPARARTSNLNEELGQVQVILSDKTGTLTCNSMQFVKCSIGGIAYGRAVSTVERAIARRKKLPLADKMKGDIEEFEQNATVKGYNFIDDRITNGNWVNEPRPDVIQMFFEVLAVCHTVIPDTDEETGNISYEAESPDEAAFVIAARELGFEFYERTHANISIQELNPLSGTKVKRTFKLLNIIEFSSSRKRMSVIVKNEEGKILLLCKGADSVIFERLAYNGREFERETREHVIGYAEAGLRTLLLSYKEVNEDEYVNFTEAFTEAKNSVSAERDKLVEEVAESIEKNLILLGATAIEDKLQDGVPECIEKLAHAGIKLWVLTGDKMETAINVGYACSLLREGMRKIVISSESNKMKASQQLLDKSAINRALKESILQDIREGLELLNLSSESSEALALIIDGKSLNYVLEDDIKNIFLKLALGCGSVICCRSSPKQKAEVTKLVKTKAEITTLAIGDGANDVSMLQEADIGVGISGFEGMQAVMASDISIGQFRFLERLLLVHGHWCYRRISLMISYYFYKNILFGFTLFYYEAYTSFSGEPAFNDWYLTFYNIIFTSLPAIALGVFDQDVSAQLCLMFPQLYQEGVKNILFSWQKIIGWFLHGILGATIIFYFCIFTLENQAFRKDGEVVGFEILGATIYTCVVWVANAQMALSINYFTFIHHLFIWGSIASWYIFILAYGAIDPNISTTAYQVFVEACAPSTSFWLVTLFASVLALLPYFILAALTMELFPSYHQNVELIQANFETDSLE